METYIIFALISMVFAWIFNFGFKIMAQRNYNVSYVSTISYTNSALISLLYIIFISQDLNFSSFYLILGLAFMNTLFFFFSSLTRVRALQVVDTTIFFPLYKTLLPVMITLFSYFFLKESLSAKEFIWILLGISVPLLLITKPENKIQKNLKLWIILIILTSIFATISTVANKYVDLFNANIDIFIFVSYMLGTVVSVCSYKIHDTYKIQKEYNKKWIYTFSIILSIIQFISFTTFMHAMSWNLAIVITVHSFSILIPIILSVMYYGEQMTYKKAFVIFLSLISIILFI